MNHLPPAILFLLAWIPSLHASPQLVVSPETFDFGEIPSGESVQATFTLRNMGDEPLHIDDVRTSCGCTSSALDQQDLPPGAETSLRANLSLQNRTGPQHKQLTIVSNDPEHPETQAFIHGTAIRFLAVSPSVICLFSVPQGQPITRTVDVFSEDHTPFQITSVEASHPDLTVGISPISSNAYRLSLTLPPSWPDGRIAESLRIHTDHPRAALLSCPITGTLQTGEHHAATP